MQSILSLYFLKETFLKASRSSYLEGRPSPANNGVPRPIEFNSR